LANDSDIRAAQALADLAAIAIICTFSRFPHPVKVSADRLGYVLDNRVVSEQAKGMLNHIATVNVEPTFGIMRIYDLSHLFSVIDVAEDGTLTANSFGPRVRSTGSRNAQRTAPFSVDDDHVPWRATGHCRP
jgi:hypothetical protein